MHQDHQSFPLSFVDILTKSVTLHLQNFVLFTAIALVPLIPNIIFNNLFQFYNSALSSSSEQVFDGKFALLFGLSFAVLICYSILAQVLIGGALFTATSKRYHGEQIGFVDAYKAVLPRFFPILITSILTAIAIFIGFLFCFIPGFFMMIALIFAVPVALFEKQPITEILPRAWNLSQGNRVDIFLVLLAFFAFLLGYGVIVGAASTFILIETGSDSTYFTIFNIVIQFGSSLLSPLPIIAIFLLYNNALLKEKTNEGFNEHPQEYSEQWIKSIVPDESDHQNPYNPPQ